MARYGQSKARLLYGNDAGAGPDALRPGRHRGSRGVSTAPSLSNSSSAYTAYSRERSVSVAPSATSDCSSSVRSYGPGSTRALTSYAESISGTKSRSRSKQSFGKSWRDERSRSSYPYRGSSRSTSDGPRRASGAATGGARSLMEEAHQRAAASELRDTQSVVSDRIDDNGQNWVTVVCEGKGVGRNVGVAAYQPSSGAVVLTQLSDSQSFIKTVHTLSVRWPSIVCVIAAMGMASSKKTALDPTDSSSKIEDTLLTKCLSKTFGRKGPQENDNGGQQDSSGVNIFPIARRFFNEEAGYEFISQLIVQDETTASNLASMKGKAHALSAASALFKFVEMTRNWVFAPHTLSIKYLPLEGTMLIDSESVKNLELVENLVDKKGRQCLLGFLCHSYSPMARRLLRTNILAPLTDISTIETRLDAVTELISLEGRYKRLRDALQALGKIDAEKIIGELLAFTSINANEKSRIRKQTDPARESERKIQLVLQIRTFVQTLPKARTILGDGGGVKSSLLATILKCLSDDRILAIDNAIVDVLNEEALKNMTAGTLSARTSRVFAIRSEKKRLLDVARETYQENIKDVDELLTELRAKHGPIMDDVELAYSPSGGFTFTIAEPVLVAKTDGRGVLPSEFSKLGKKGQKVVFNCTDLIKRNARIAQSLEEVFLLSSDVLDELLVAIKTHIGVLYRCSEVVALLDTLAGFAHIVISGSGYVRPEFTDTLAIKDGRHPILERYKFREGSFVPNDTYATTAHSFQILTGPNMSGKTTFLKQVALLTVMSQIGSFIPADYASFCVHDALLTRLSNEDSIDDNLSTFALEMKIMSMILSALSSCKNALVIVDELGRGTSPQEGIGLAHAIAEEIIKNKTICFFATHYLGLTQTLAPIPNVVTLHLETEVSSKQVGRSNGDFNLTFSHRVRDGTTSVANYGLEIAKVAALPANMLTWAAETTAQLTDMEEHYKKDSQGTRTINKRKVLFDTAASLRQAYNSSRLDDRRLRAYVQSIIDQAVIGLTADMEQPQEDDTQEEEVRQSQSGLASPEVHSDETLPIEAPQTLYSRLGELMGTQPDSPGPEEGVVNDEIDANGADDSWFGGSPSPAARNERPEDMVVDAQDEEKPASLSIFESSDLRNDRSVRQTAETEQEPVASDSAACREITGTVKLVEPPAPASQEPLHDAHPIDASQADSGVGHSPDPSRLHLTPRAPAPAGAIAAAEKASLAYLDAGETDDEIDDYTDTTSERDTIQSGTDQDEEEEGEETFGEAPDKPGVQSFDIASQSDVIERPATAIHEASDYPADHTAPDASL